MQNVESEDLRLTATPGIDTSGYIYLAMTANGWGCGPTEAKAIAACKSHMGHRHVARYGVAVYRVHPDFRVSEIDGSVYTPKGHPAIKVRGR